MKKIIDILGGLQIQQIIGSDSVKISEIHFDSRKVIENSLFVASKGTQTDGHNYISIAITKGAKAILCEQIPEQILETITYIKVENASHALGIIASNFYENPSSKLKLVGITGTNGKTTTATLLYRLFSSLGYKSGLFSTVAYFIDKIELEASHTTPDAIQLNHLLAQMVDQGCEYCFMEVSSHSVVQHRIAGLTFAGGIFSNITHDHLDFHKTFAEYIKAKKGFFDNLPKSAFALTNIDDKNGNVMLQNTAAKKSTYAISNFADFKARVLENHFEGMLLNIDGVDVYTHFIGGFNACNLLAVYSAAILLGVEKEIALTVLSGLLPVSGRFETINMNNVTAIVDYAHTPDALINVLQTINEIRGNEQNLITVVGAGGDRDKTKRPIMAKVSAKYSDKVILTSDNPRTEKPEQIIEEMYAGIENHEIKKVLKIADRREAIKTACLLARRGDIILIAGKGHETYQEINGVKNHFDDKEVVKEALLMIAN